MGRTVIILLGVGVGWIFGITVMMLLMPLGGQLNFTFMEAMGNTFVFGFPGFLMLIIAIIVSLTESKEDDFLKEKF